MSHSTTSCVDRGRSLTNPEGNITGFSLLAVLDGKRQEILIDLVPWGAPRGVHHRPQYTSPQRAQLLQEAAHTRGVELVIYPVFDSR